MRRTLVEMGMGSRSRRSEGETGYCGRASWRARTARPGILDAGPFAQPASKFA
jgi:hypothetical protein